MSDIAKDRTYRLSKSAREQMAADADRAGFDQLASVLADLADRAGAPTGTLVDVGYRVTPPSGDDSRVPGVWWPALGRIDLDGGLLPDRPDGCDPDDDDTRSAVAALYGVLLHEVGHACHSRWGWPEHVDQGTAQAWVLRLLEEIRMEAQVVRHDPAKADWLRAAASRLLLEDATVDTDDTSVAAKLTAAAAATLTAGRVVAGSLRASDVAALDGPLRDVLGDVLADLVVAWKDAVDVADDDGDGLAAVAARVCELLDVDEDAQAGGMGETSDGDGAGSPSEGSSDSDGSGDPDGEGGPGTGDGELMDAVRAALGDAAADAAEQVDGTDELADLLDVDWESTVPGGDEWDGTGDSGATGETTESPADWRDKDADSKRRGHASSRPTSAVRWKTRRPATTERALRRRVARELERARLRDRRKTSRDTEMPPGRLRMRSALAADGQRSAGQAVTARPFRRTRRQHVPAPNLRVALMVDTSGSMGSVQERVSSAAWVLAGAVHDVGGRCAIVGFGDDVATVLPVGTNPDMVAELVCNGATELARGGLDHAAELADLTRPDAQRLLVILSDGQWWGPSQQVKSDRRIRELRDQGCHVMQVMVGGEPYVHGADETCTIDTPDDLLSVVTRRAVKMLEQA